MQVLNYLSQRETLRFLSRKPKTFSPILPYRPNPNQILLVLLAVARPNPFEGGGVQILPVRPFGIRNSTIYGCQIEFLERYTGEFLDMFGSGATTSCFDSGKVRQLRWLPVWRSVPQSLSELCFIETTITESPYEYNRRNNTTENSVIAVFMPMFK